MSSRWDGRRGSLGTTGSDESKGQGPITLPHLPPVPPISSTALAMLLSWSLPGYVRR